MSSKATAWEDAERVCFNWLVGKTGAVSFQTAFIGRLPPIVNAWMFALTGGEMEIETVPGTQSCSWRMAAEFVGVWKERADAQRVAGLLRDAMPIGTAELKGVIKFKWTGEPTLTDDVVDVAKVGLRPVWRLQIPMDAVFFGVDD